MSVLLTNALLGLRRRVEGTRNSHGERMPGGYGAFHGPFGGRVNARADGTWSLAVDPALWPVRVGDLIISTTGGSWLVQTSDLIQNSYDSYVDWIRVSALHRSNGGTEPGGAWFVARFSEGIEQPAEESTTVPQQVEAHLWTGHGPPPATEFGAAAGDEYIDLNTGIVYAMGT